MTAARARHLADLIRGMRTPLARVELAASQLAREAATPAARDLASGISSAVARLDRDVEASLRQIGQGLAAADRCEDLSPALAGIRARIEPVLRARAIDWSGDEPGDAELVFGDPQAMRRAALALLRHGITWAGAGGCLAVRLLADPARDRIGVVLSVRPGPHPGQPTVGLEEIALEQGCDCEITRSPDATRAVLWIGSEESTCRT